MLRQGIQSARAGESGFTLVAMIVAIVIVGIMLGATGQIWSTIKKRDREEELLFRGTMIRNAIERWYKPLPGQHAATPLQELKHLQDDPRALQKGQARFLSRLYLDPLTGEEWTVVKNEGGGIIGVASASQDAPFKTAGFPEELKEFEGKQKYSEWKFVYTVQLQVPPPGTVQPGGTTSPGGTTPPPTQPEQEWVWDVINGVYKKK